jgi:hypothetical protein
MNTASKGHWPDSFRAQLRKNTGMDGDVLDALMTQLRDAIARTKALAELYETESPAKRKKELDGCVQALGFLAFAPTWARETVGLSSTDLFRRMTVVRQLALQAESDIKSNRPIGVMRDALARKARQLLAPHCGEPPSRKLRLAVDAVLKEAGMRGLNPKKEGARCDVMLRPLRRDKIADEAAARATERRGKIGDIPI